MQLSDCEMGQPCLIGLRKHFWKPRGWAILKKPALTEEGGGGATSWASAAG